MSTSRVSHHKIFNFGLIKKINPAIVFILLAIITFGSISIYSADNGKSSLYLYHALSPILFSPIVIFIVCINPRYIIRYSYYLYFLSIILLFATYAFGYTSMGAKRWLNIGFTRIQTSDIAKIAIILALSKHFAYSNISMIKSIKNIIKPFLMIIIPFSFILIQPDFGTGFIFIVIALSIFLVSGIRIIKFVLGGVIILASAPIIWSQLHDYQKTRILVFINQDQDKLGSGYNINQAKIAVGSGGVFGVGINMGGQAKLGFLPESKTDFIFTVFAQEFGFVGCVCLIFLYGLLILYGCRTSIVSKNFFLKITSFGATMMLFLHIVMNICMTIELIPTVGIPLPFLSYGRTIMVMSMICVALIMNADINKYGDF
jgi:rod shape determining protein RodA